MSKIKILVAPGDRAGSGKFRCVDPHVNLQNNFPEDFFVEINHQIDFNDINYLKGFDAVFIHRLPQHNHKDAVAIINTIKRLGLKVIIDTDDHWNLDPSHGLYHIAKINKIPETILDCIRMADLVTVPTEILAAEVRKFNKNVVVLPNAVDPNEDPFKPKETASDMIRFGWLGGSSHIKDIELLKGVPQRAKEYADKVQFVLCGYDTRGKVRMFNKETNQWMEREMQPVETTWFMYEIFITDNFRLLEKYPDLDEETLAMVIFNKTRGTALGEQQNDVVIKSKNKINIVGQYLKTNEKIGYVITDIDKVYDPDAIETLKNIPGTIRFRTLY